MLIDWVGTERALLPRVLTFVGKVLQNARPAVKMAALGDAWRSHHRCRLHANWALCLFPRRDHVWDVVKFNHVFPVNQLARIIQILYVSSLRVHGELFDSDWRFENKRKRCLHVLFFVK
jgi:hypothetical protein